METLALVPDFKPSDAGPRGESPGACFQRRPARLRVALLADSPTQPLWVAEAFRETALASWASLVLLVTGRARGHRLPRGWRFYQRVERLLAGRHEDPAQAWDIRHLGPHLVTLADPDVDTWREELRHANPDVVFLLGDDAFTAHLVPAVADVARFGAWRFCFGRSPSRGASAHASSSQWAGLAEVAAGDPITTSRLVACLPDGSERLLTESWTRTLLFSTCGNRSRLLRRTALYPARALRNLCERGSDWLAQQPPLTSPSPSVSAAPRAPAVLPAAGRIGGRALVRSVQKLACVDQWFLAYRFGEGEPGGPWGQQDWGPFTCLIPPKDRFWADPFPIKWGERYLVFFEELPFATQRAHIAVMEIAADGSHSAPRPVLARDYHLSYPFLFEAEGRLFMIPETGQNRTVELYSCQRIPDQWRLEKVLLQDAYYVDASIHRADGRWWMFVNVGSDVTNLHDELHLYYADHFLGPWHAHAGNPVKSDVRGARSAGRLFEDAGSLYRPAQICAPLYGSGLSLNRVQVLNPERYEEQEVGRILPPWGSRVLGIHTLNRAGRLTVVDGFLRRRRFGRDGLDSFEPERLLPGHGGEGRS